MKLIEVKSCDKCPYRALRIHSRLYHTDRRITGTRKEWFICKTPGTKDGDGEVIDKRTKTFPRFCSLRNKS